VSASAGERNGWQGQILNSGQITATDDLFISDATLTLDPGTYSVADRVYADDGSIVTFDAAFSAQSLTVAGGSTVNLVATSNLSADVDVAGAGSTLNLADDLTLTDDLYVYGSNTEAAIV